MLKGLVQDFIGLFYPRLCLACRQHLAQEEDVLCLQCEYGLPLTHYAGDVHNPLTMRLMGRVPVEAITALYHYQKDSNVAALVAQLKYKEHAEVGEIFGRRLGHSLQEHLHWNAVDVVVPVPLHPRKLQERGYNQAAILARGVAAVLGKPFIEDALKRNVYKQSQTAMDRVHRMENVLGMFSVARPEALHGKHVLLIDDVLTTGATVEACWLPMAALEKIKISVATLAAATQ
jgi:ComF family protein